MKRVPGLVSVSVLLGSMVLVGAAQERPALKDVFRDA
jgi:hypothetical protein